MGRLQKSHSYSFLTFCFKGAVKGLVAPKKLIAVVVVGAAVNLVGARLESQVNAASRVAAGLRRRLGLGRELIYRIDRKNDAGDS